MDHLSNNCNTRSDTYLHKILVSFTFFVLLLDYLLIFFLNPHSIYSNTWPLKLRERFLPLDCRPWSTFWLICFENGLHGAATACNGNDAGQFPKNNLFATAGEGIWDNGASCGRQYRVRCLSAVVPRTCNLGELILVKIVDRAQTSVSKPLTARTTMVLSTTAFGTIANSSAASINIEFQE